MIFEYLGIILLFNMKKSIFNLPPLDQNTQNLAFVSA